MNRYWDIRTGATTIMNRFITLVNENNLLVGDELIENDDEYIYTLINKNGQILYKFSSKSVKNQYLTTWEALGLIIKNNFSFKIATILKEYKLLCLYSLLFIIQESVDKKVNAYRNTIIINILVEAKVINSLDLSKKHIVKQRGQLKIENIKKTISNYEKYFSKNKEILKIIKEIYDKKF